MTLVKNDQVDPIHLDEAMRERIEKQLSRKSEHVEVLEVVDPFRLRPEIDAERAVQLSKSARSKTDIVALPTRRDELRA